MLAAVPILFFALAFLAHRRSADRAKDGDWRDSFVVAAVVWGVVLAAATEIAGGFGVFRVGPVLLLWGVASAGAALAATRGTERRLHPSPASGAPRQTEVAALSAGVVLVLPVVGITALAAPPNTWDALTYHLARVAHWIQSERIAFFPTHILRQLDLPPFAEYAIANLMLLAGSDRVSTSVQWFALVGCAVASSLVTRELGAGPRAQAGAAVFAVTIPMAVLQGSSAQNDLVAAFWLLCLAFFLLLARRQAGWAPPLGFGACLGLGLLTKGSFYLFAVPFVVWLVLLLWRTRRRKAWRALLLAGSVAAALNLAHWSRNLSLFDSPLGAGHGVLNESPGLSVLASNAVRNLAVHLASPFAPANRAVEGAVGWFHRLLGADPSDPRTTWRGATFRVPPVAPGAPPAEAEEALYGMLHEDSAGNPLHLALLLAAGLACLSASRRRRLSAAPAYLAVLGAAFLLFSGALKWQPWNSRLELPLFLLGAPLVAAALLEDSRRLAVLLPSLLLLAAVPWLLANATRPLIGPDSVLAAPRVQQYFAGRPGLFAPSLAAARVTAGAGCRRVGLRIGPDDGEYLFRVALERAAGRPVWLEHVSVRNRSASLASGSRPAAFEPCALLTTVPEESTSAEAEEEVHRFGWAGGAVTVRLLRSGEENPRR